MFEHCLQTVRWAERVAAVGDSRQALSSLRRLSLDDFAEVLLAQPNAEFPALAALLPRMASVEVQENWTGASGRVVMAQACNFARMVVDGFWRLKGRPLDGARILDFGCGWGRILRLMYYFSDIDNVYGVDPWDRSLEICAEDGVLGHLAQSDYLPTSLPFGDISFDVIYAFSVFTHLSERATRMALAALRQRISPDGMLVITIRPVEYWALAAGWDKTLPSAALKKQHQDTGFAFQPHNRTAVDGDVTYGDTSMTLDWLRSCEGWSVARYDRSLDDHVQMIVFLLPV